MHAHSKLLLEVLLLKKRVEDEVLKPAGISDGLQFGSHMMQTWGESYGDPGGMSLTWKVEIRDVQPDDGDAKEVAGGGIEAPSEEGDDGVVDSEVARLAEEMAADELQQAMDDDAARADLAADFVLVLYFDGESHALVTYSPTEKSWRAGVMHDKDGRLHRKARAFAEACGFAVTDASVLGVPVSEEAAFGLMRAMAQKAIEADAAFQKVRRAHTLSVN